MSLEAWGDENPMDAGPMRECGNCDGSGEVEENTFDSVLFSRECPCCRGTGEVPYEYEPFEDDVL